MARLKAVRDWVVAGALGWSTAGCVAPLTSPLDGGRPWRELKSEHYTLSTDASSENATELLQLLEDGHYALQRAAFPYAPPLGGSSRVIFIDGLVGLQELGYIGVAGIALHPSHRLDDSDLFVLSDPESQWNLEFLHHEVTHRFVHFYYPNAPFWLNEGLAEYYSTLQIEGGTALIGGYVSDRSFADERWAYENDRVVIPVADVPGVGALRSMSAEAFYAQQDTAKAEQARTAHYAGAWALIHTLADVHGPRGLQTYLTDLHSGTVSEADAWRKTFGSAEPTLDARLRSFLLSYQTITQRVPIGAPPRVQPTERALTSSEVHTLWALARNRQSQAGREAIRADLDRAIAADPNAPEPYLRRALLNADDGRVPAAADDHRKAVSLANGDSRYTFGLALFSLSHGDVVKTSQLDAWALAIAKTARSAGELDFLAQWALVRNRQSAGRHYARKAIRADASCFYCYATLARSFAGRSEWSGAVEAIRIAINLLPDGYRDSDYPELLARYERELELSSRSPAPALPEPAAPEQP